MDRLTATLLGCISVVTISGDIVRVHKEMSQTTDGSTTPITAKLVDDGANPDYITTPRPGYDCKYIPKDKNDFLGDLYAGRTLYSRPSQKSGECMGG